MKVLAYRSNRIFFVAPIVILLYLFILYAGLQMGLGRRLRHRILGSVGALAVAMMCAFVERLFMPKILIEWDDCGLYIYKYRNSEPILVRYENIIGHYMEIGVGSEEITIGQMSPEQVGFVSNNAVGTLCIRIAGKEVEDIRIRGISNVKQVKIELNKKLRDLKNKQQEEIDEMIEARRREREAEEQKKHDPNT